MDGIDWVAADWGTSNLRVWGLDSESHVLTEASSNKGMARLDRSDFEPALLELIDGWLPQGGRATPVMACGMVGARQGWIEVPYRQAPCTPFLIEDAASPTTRDPRLKVMVLGGIKQIAPAADVMRGEETQIAGVLLANPGFDGVICLPGTHTKWVRVAEGNIAHFQTFMTGELFNLLATQSVLRHSVGADGWDTAEFAASIVDHPENIAGRLFSIRADALVSALAPVSAKARLSGTLIGAELAAARRYWQNHEVIIVGNGVQAGTYFEGLGILGKSSRILDSSEITLAGLKSAYGQIRDHFR